MIIITNPTSIPNEMEIINTFFQEGLVLLHVRKPDYSEEKMKVFLSSVNEDYRSRLVLHSHHQLAASFGIKRLHFTKEARMQSLNLSIRSLKSCSYILSTSTHSIAQFNQLSDVFDYAFLSPVFRSISKENYESEINLFEEIKNRTNSNTKLIALGGITSDKIKVTIENGFDGVAVLGHIWNSSPITKNFNLCQQIDHSY